MNKDIDIICMGRAAVDLYSEQIGATLENASTFAKYVGGCPANISIGTSRLGLKSALLSRVGDEAMGKFLRNTLENEGVDTSHLVTDKERLTGLVLLGISPPNNFPLIFYRENCADMAISSQDFTDDYLARGKALLVTGTHCSREDIFSVTKDAIKRAIAVDTQIILDIDYRPVLWGKTGHGGGEERYSNDALFAERMSEVLPYCNLVVGTEEEIMAATHCECVEKGIEILKQIVPGVIVRKCGEEGCIAYDKKSNSPTIGRPFSVKVLNVLGAGDAFMSGFLRGYLKGHSIEDCCTFANANGALVVTRHGCSPAMPYWIELAKFMNDPKNLGRTERIHQAINQKPVDGEMHLLAFDHRGYFESLIERYGCDASKVEAFKQLVFKAFEICQKENQDYTLGCIVDGKYGEDILKEAQHKQIQTFRCIEQPNSFPLEFIDNQEAAYILRQWPIDQSIKVLCYVADDEKNVEQIKRLKVLQQASLQTNHKLLIEIVEREKSYNLRRVKTLMKKCYQQNIYPQWWKLQPIEDYSSWEEINDLIEHYDPYNHGIFLLGENRSIEELSTYLSNIAFRITKIKGFAIGRTIWGQPAEKWFAQNASNEETINEIASRFNFLINHWKKEQVTL